MQSPIQPLAAPIAREHSAGTVGAMSAWSEANDQEPGVCRSKIRNRSAPIFKVPVCSPLYRGHRFAMFSQPGTKIAFDNLLIE